MKKFIIININSLTDSIMAASVHDNPYSLKLSNADSNGNRDVLLEMESIPVDVFKLGAEVLSERQTESILETEVSKWEDVDVTGTGAYSNDKSMSFDGINENLNLGTSINYEPNDAFSFSLWVNPQNVAAQRTIFAMATNDSSVNGITVYHRSDAKLFIQLRPPSQLHNIVMTDLTLTAGVWNHIVLTNAGSGNISGFNAYLNGVLGTKDKTSGTFTNSWQLGQDLILGSRNNNFYYNGLIDEFLACNKELSLTEVGELYNSGAAQNPLSTTFESSITNYYRMGDIDTYPTVTDVRGGVDGTMVNMDATNFIEDAP